MIKYSYSLCLWVYLFFVSCSGNSGSKDDSHEVLSQLVPNTFQLVDEQELVDGRVEMYLNEDSMSVNVYTHPFLKEILRSRISPVSHMAYSSLAKTQSQLKEIGASIYAESSRVIYIEVGNRKIESRRMILSGSINNENIKSLMQIVEGDSLIFYIFQYASETKSFRPETVEPFIQKWLSSKLKTLEFPEGKREESISNYELYEDSNYEYLLEKYGGQELAHFLPEAGRINVNPIVEKDILTAVLVHEMVHGGQLTQVGIDERMAEICREFDIHLTLNDYIVWGKRELAADLSTLHVLTGLPDGYETIRRYGFLRGIRKEIIQSFISHGQKEEKQEGKK